MVMIDSGTYEFKSLSNAVDFVKPLVVEGYSVAINTVYKDFPFRDSIDKFTVDVGKKGCKIAIHDPDEKGIVKKVPTTEWKMFKQVITKNRQLRRAKEIIKKFSEFVNNEVEYDPEHPQEYTDLWNELCEQAKQFLKEE